MQKSSADERGNGDRTKKQIKNEEIRRISTLKSINKHNFRAKTLFKGISALFRSVMPK